MKKLFALLISVSVLLSFASCSGGYNKEFAPDYWYDTPAEEYEQYIYGEGQNNGIYEEYIENKYISAAENAVSTISADVDTVSYSLFRKLVNSGVKFESLAERYYYSHTEEMINYFRYDYDLPSEDELFGITSVISDCPWNGDSKLLVLGMQTEELAETKANNLVFLIDVSGSMNSESKLGLIKKSFAFLIDNLGENDVVSIVTYAGNAGVVLEGCNGADHKKIKNAVDSLKAGGSTYGQAGLEMAYGIAEQYYIADGNNRIIIASDGDFNVGISSSESMTEYISAKRGIGINCSALWFGDGIESYGIAIMESIANNGGGVYYYIDGLTEAEKVFGTDLCATLNTVASDVKIQLTFDPEYVDSYRLVGYENRVMSADDFNDDTKDAAEVGAGHSVTVMYELKLKDSDNADAEWLKLAVRYKRSGEESSTLNEYGIGARDFTDTPSEDFKFACAVAETSMLINKSEYIDEDITLSEVLKSLSNMQLTGYKAEFRTLLEKLSK